MLEMNGLVVAQQGQHYAIYLPQGIQVGLIWMGQDGQIAHDVLALAPITKALQKRWRVPNSTKQN